MSGVEETIHDRLVELAAPPPQGWVVDLGCGAGPTLEAFARRRPDSQLVGVDRSAGAVAAAREALASHAGFVSVLCADLRSSAPLAGAFADVVVSYNVLECLPDPGALLCEAHRLLKPGGRAVVAHVDFDSVVIAGAPRVLDRRICHAFTDDKQPWMDHADGRIGRNLAGLVGSSPLVLESVEPWVASSTVLEGQAARRVENIRSAVAAAAGSRRTVVTEDEVGQWQAAIQGAAEHGEFFFAEMAVIATARRPAEN